MRDCIIILIIIFFPFISFSQFTIDWQQSYGGMEWEGATDIVETEGGFFIGGSTTSTDGQITCATEDAFYWMLKIDYEGNIIKQWCHNNYDAMRLFKSKGDNPYYYMIGETYSDVTNLLVAKFDPHGRIIWEKGVGSTTGVFNWLIDGTTTNDGGVIAVANICSGGGDVTEYFGSWDGWITKFDSTGKLQWDCTIGTEKSENIQCITQLSDGNYIAGLVGLPDSSGMGNINCSLHSPDKTDIIIYKIDSLGNPYWNMCFGGSQNENICEILELQDGYILAASTNSRDGDALNGGLHGDTEEDVWIIKLDLEGSIIWQKCYGGVKNELPYRIFQTNDDGFIVFARAESWDCDLQGNIPHSNPSIWIFKIDSEGEMLWQKCIHSTAREGIVNGVIKHSDNKFTIAGEMTHSPNYDVNCSNFDSGSRENFYVAGISITTVATPEQFYNESEFKIYPVPSSGSVTIEIPQQPQQEPFTINFIDLKGIIRKSETQIQLKAHYDIHHLPPGMYMVRIKNSMGVVYKKMMVGRY